MAANHNTARAARKVQPGLPPGILASEVWRHYRAAARQGLEVIAAHCDLPGPDGWLRRARGGADLRRQMGVACSTYWSWIARYLVDGVLVQTDPGGPTHPAEYAIPAEPQVRPEHDGRGLRLVTGPDPGIGVLRESEYSGNRSTPGIGVLREPSQYNLKHTSFGGLQDQLKAGGGVATRRGKNGARWVGDRLVGLERVDLSETGRLMGLFDGAVAAGRMTDSDAGRLAWVTAAERALRVASVPEAMFASFVHRGQVAGSSFQFAADVDEDAAAKRIKAHEHGEPVQEEDPMIERGTDALVAKKRRDWVYKQIKAAGAFGASAAELAEVATSAASSGRVVRAEEIVEPINVLAADGYVRPDGSRPAGGDGPPWQVWKVVTR